MTMHFRLPENYSMTSFKKKALAWTKNYSKVAYFDSNEFSNSYQRYEGLIAVANQGLSIPTAENLSFEKFEKYRSENKFKWHFGYFSYDLKNELEKLESNNLDSLNFPKLSFFAAEIVIILEKDNEKLIKIESDNPEKIWIEILSCTPIDTDFQPNGIQISKRISKTEFLEKVQAIKNHIIEGDIYELNFCQEFFSEQVDLNPLQLYQRLNEISPAPFSAFYRNDANYILCASPERFVYKSVNKLVSQPIKGTIQRGNSVDEDNYYKNKLLNSEKDKAENVMIVDLVRNDLNRVCRTGTVEVEELFGIYPFRQVFQMISTVSGILKDERSATEAIKALFPMGSMTGAPKIMSMQLIEHLEESKRGPYSGALGYISPDNDFDFNVLIRSIMYNQKKKYLSFQTGGAIVYDSEPEAEYEECLLKAQAILNTLNAELD
jgi:para-aminobenzoate synthetase component 1